MANPTAEQTWAMSTLLGVVDTSGELTSEDVANIVLDARWAKAIADTPEEHRDDMRRLWKDLLRSHAARKDFVKSRKDSGRSIAEIVNKIFSKVHADEDMIVLDSISKKRDKYSTSPEVNMNQEEVKNPKNLIDNVEIEYASDKELKKIIVPDGMPLSEVKEWVERRMVEDESEVNVHEIVDAYPLDGALALAETLQEIYGWTSLKPTPGFFGSTPPAIIGVQVSATETKQVAWGRMEIPGVSGHIQTSLHWERNIPRLLISGTIKQGDKRKIDKIAKRVRERIAKYSIYRHKALRMRFLEPASATSIEDFNPEFMNLKDVDTEELVFSKEVSDQIQTSLFNPIIRTDLCRKHQIPLKRGVLLAGKYGTGKTMTAKVAAKHCMDTNEWTFIYLKDVKDLEKAIYFAKQYMPAMIFAEDIDQAANGDDSERDLETNNILNTIDGIDTKDSEIVVVLTTNHLDKINPAMLRPGRLDAVIPVTPPDGEAIARLFTIYGRGTVADSPDLINVGNMLAEQNAIPAMVREVVERSKLAALGRAGELRITAEDLSIAAKGMAEHLKLLRPRVEDNRGDVEKSVDKMAAYFGDPNALEIVKEFYSADDVEQVTKVAAQIAEGNKDSGQATG